jgi:hypothetical protein
MASIWTVVSGKCHRSALALAPPCQIKAVARLDALKSARIAAVLFGGLRHLPGNTRELFAI